VKWKFPMVIPLPCAFHSNSSDVDATHAPTNHKGYDPLHIITWPYWFIDLDLTYSSPLPRSISAKSCPSFTVTRGPSLESLRLALHTCNRSIEPNLISIFSTLVTWIHVMSHMQYAPSWHNHMWTNLMCISH
jgi:hypothetical protein